MESLEGAVSIPANRPWEAGPSCSEPQVPSAAEGTKEANNRSDRQGEGHHKEIFFHAPVIVQDVTRNSSAAGGRRCNGSVPMHAAGLWNEFWSGRGAGGNATRAGDELPMI